MANNLPELVSKWEFKTNSVIIPVVGAINAIPANPERLAIGFVHVGASNISAFPAFTPQATFFIWLRGNVNEWFYWQKHGSMVSQAWSFSSDLGAPDAIGYCEILRTAIGE
jgi:hypothetical protein